MKIYLQATQLMLDIRKAFDSSFAYVNSGMGISEVRTVRGMLICLVVLAHISSQGGLFYELKSIIYNFHVMGFFMVSLIRPVPRFEFIEFRVIIRKYLGLLLPTSFLAFLCFNLIIKNESFLDVLEALPRYIVTLFSGNYKQFNEITGLELFWFMYALLGCTVLRMICHRLSGVSNARSALLILSGALGIVSAKYFSEIIPAWLGVACYVLPTAIASFLVLELFRKFKEIVGRWFFVVHVLIFFLISIFWAESHRYNVAWLRVPTLFDPFDLIVWILYLAVSFHVLIALSEQAVVKKVFENIGLYSLEIYLSHMFVLYPLDSFMRSLIGVELVRILVVFFVTLLVALVVSKLINYKKICGCTI